MYLNGARPSRVLRCSLAFGLSIGSIDCLKQIIESMIPLQPVCAAKTLTQHSQITLGEQADRNDPFRRHFRLGL